MGMDLVTTEPDIQDMEPIVDTEPDTTVPDIQLLLDTDMDLDTTELDSDTDHTTEVTEDTTDQHTLPRLSDLLYLIIYSIHFRFIENKLYINFSSFPF